MGHEDRIEPDRPYTPWEGQRLLFEGRLEPRSPEAERKVRRLARIGLIKLDGNAIMGSSIIRYREEVRKRTARMERKEIEKLFRQTFEEFEKKMGARVDALEKKLDKLRQERVRKEWER